MQLSATASLFFANLLHDTGLTQMLGAFAGSMAPGTCSFSTATCFGTTQRPCNHDIRGLRFTDTAISCECQRGCS